jgi:hypothetical protein
LISKDDGATLVHIPEEHTQLGAYVRRLDAQVWSRFGAIAVILTSLMYLFVWN